MSGHTLYAWAIVSAAAFLLVIWIQSAVSLAGRRRQLANLAQRLSMMPLERDTLPSGMVLDETDLRRWIRIVNAYVGRLGEAEIAFFDCSLHFGNARWSRTVIARRGSSALGLPEAVGADCVTERAGDWQAVFRPRETFNINRPFMAVEHIETALSNLSKIG